MNKALPNIDSVFFAALEKTSSETLKEHTGGVLSVAFSLRGRRIVSSDVRTLKVWDASMRQEAPEE